MNVITEWNLNARAQSKIQNIFEMSRIIKHAVKKSKSCNMKKSIFKKKPAKLKLTDIANTAIKTKAPIYGIATSSGFWYDITNNKFKVDILINDKRQIKKVNEAIKLLQSLESVYDKVVG